MAFFTVAEQAEAQTAGDSPRTARSKPASRLQPHGAAARGAAKRPTAARTDKGEPTTAPATRAVEQRLAGVAQADGEDSDWHEF
jgi:hypothetical protein